jgi:hypothetical protein
LKVGEFDEPVDLPNGKPRIVLVNEVEWLPEVEAVDDS